MENRIAELRRARGLKQADLAAELGISQASLSNWETGRNEPDLQGLKQLSDIFAVSVDYLMKRTHNSTPAPAYPANIIPLPDGYEVPLVGEIACGQPIPAIEDASETVMAPGHIRVNFALRCKGDSMINARIFDGDIVYIRAQEGVENGQIAAVRIGDEATLKKVYYNKQDGRLVLRACNPLFPDQVYEGEALNEIEILGLAIGFYSAVRHEM